MSKRGPGEVTNKERGAPAGGEPHPERVEPLLVREESREDDAIFNQDGLNPQCVHWTVGFPCSKKSPVVATGECSYYRGITIANGE